MQPPVACRGEGDGRPQVAAEVRYLRYARLHGAADQALAQLGETLEPPERGLRDQDGQRLRSAVGAEAFDAEYSTGTSLSTAEVLAPALGSEA